MTTTAPVANGRPQRKLLSEELDRLDSIVDSIAEGLPMAVAAAARAAGNFSAIESTIESRRSSSSLRSFRWGRPLATDDRSVPSRGLADPERRFEECGRHVVSERHGGERASKKDSSLLNNLW